MPFGSVHMGPRSVLTTWAGAVAGPFLGGGGAEDSPPCPAKASPDSIISAAATITNLSIVVPKKLRSPKINSALSAEMSGHDRGRRLVPGFADLRQIWANAVPADTRPEGVTACAPLRRGCPNLTAA